MFKIFKFILNHLDFALKLFYSLIIPIIVFIILLIILYIKFNSLYISLTMSSVIVLFFYFNIMINMVIYKIDKLNKKIK